MKSKEQLEAARSVLLSEVHDLYHSMTDSTTVAEEILRALEIEPPSRTRDTSGYYTISIPYDVWRGFNDAQFYRP